MSLISNSVAEQPVENRMGDGARAAMQRSLELEAEVRRRIRQMTAGQVHALEVRAIDRQIFISGNVTSYYLKQLAIQGAIAAIRGDDAMQIECRIVVFHRLPWRA